MSIQDLVLQDSLGNGVSGEVKKAYHKHTKKLFAVKIIPLKFDKLVQNLIQQEVKTLHNCKHENIIKCYASFNSVKN